jgi:hypothetical protein
MYFLIGVWGGDNRLYAAIKFFLYTMVGSVVMLLGILKMYFLTQDGTLALSIPTGTLDNIAAAGTQARVLLDNAHIVAKSGAGGNGTFNIMYMQAMGSMIPLDLQVLLLPLPSVLPLRCRCFPFTPGCPTLTLRRPPQAQLFSQASC